MIQKLSRFFRLSPRELVVLALVFAGTLPVVTPRIYASDEVQYFSYLRSLWFDHDVSFENEYQYFYDHGIAQTPGFHETFLERVTPAGRRINFGTIGSPMLWAPFYGVADLVVRVTGIAPADGFSRPYVAAVAYGSASYGFLAVLLGIRAARMITGHGLGSGVMIWLGTPVVFYMYLAPSFAHACSAFAVALFITIWLHVRRTWSMPGAIALGCASVLVAMVREQDVFFLGGPALDFVVTAWRARGSGERMKRLLVSGSVTVLAFGIAYLPQLVAYQALNGRPGPSQYVTRKMLWHSPRALQVLFDPEHGLFFWTPLAALAIAGLVVMIVRAETFFRLKAEATRLTSGEEDTRRVAVCLLVMAALQVYVSGAVDSWTVAGAFGQRRFVALTSILIIGLAALWQWASTFRVARVALRVVVAIAVYWNLALIALFGTRMMDRQRIEVRRNAYDAFVTLPRMAPDLAWRYLVNRDSFYKPQPARDGR